MERFAHALTLTRHAGARKDRNPGGVSIRIWQQRQNATVVTVDDAPCDPHTEWQGVFVISHDDWIAAETRPAGLRLWAMRGAERLDRREVGPVPPNDPQALMQAVGDWHRGPLLLADPAGAWGNGVLPLVPAPAALQLQPLPAEHRVWIAQGLTQADHRIRLGGQTALVSGLLAAQPGFDGVVCLTGPSSFWLRISAGEICHFRGYLTGTLLQQIGGDRALAEVGSDPDLCASAAEDALGRPHRAYGRFLELRGAAGADASRLAGTLIGCELADAKPYWLGETVAIMGEAPLARLYADSLARQGVAVLPADPEAALLAGLNAARKTLV